LRPALYPRIKEDGEAAQEVVGSFQGKTLPALISRREILSRK